MPENNYAHLGPARIIKSNRITNYKNYVKNQHHLLLPPKLSPWG
jgi:hypothetical protein